MHITGFLGLATGCPSILTAMMLSPGWRRAVDVDDHVDVDFDAVQGGGGPVLHAGPPIASSNTFLAAPFLAAAAAQSTIPAQELSDRQEADMLVSFCHSFHFFF